MEIEEIKIEDTTIKFFDDFFVGDTEKMNFKTFENIIKKVMKNLISEDGL